MGYQEKTGEELPQFGITTAVSYNVPRLNGWSPVMVAQLLSNGSYLKAGVQYYRRSPALTFFTWAVADLMKNAGVSYFVLSRYAPKPNRQLKLFAQLESLNDIPAGETGNYNFIQRVRIGLSAKTFQCGVGMDSRQTGRKAFASTTNPGVFIRYEFQ